MILFYEIQKEKSGSGRPWAHQNRKEGGLLKGERSQGRKTGDQKIIWQAGQCSVGHGVDRLGIAGLAW
jgi:hypothetical protein